MNQGPNYPTHICS